MIGLQVLITPTGWVTTGIGCILFEDGTFIQSEIFNNQPLLLATTSLHVVVGNDNGVWLYRDHHLVQTFATKCTHLCGNNRVLIVNNDVYKWSSQNNCMIHLQQLDVEVELIESIDINLNANTIILSTKQNIIVYMLIDGIYYESGKYNLHGETIALNERGDRFAIGHPYNSEFGNCTVCL
jgi:hypothetical protein